MREEQIIGADGKTIRIRVVMSGEMTMPDEGFIRKNIAKERLIHLIPGYKEAANVIKPKLLKEHGIILCKDCNYPQPIENQKCCFCEELILKKN